jgi:hypothetical protein
MDKKKYKDYYPLPCRFNLMYDPMKKLLFVIFIVIALSLAGIMNGYCQDKSTAEEYQVKAAFLYNFARFIEWPKHTLASTDTFNLCILGDDPFGDSLNLIKGKMIGNKRLEVKFCKDINDVGQCHILFISSSEKSHLTALLSGLRNAHVLTVSDIEGFAKRGGIINFFTEENKIRFEINVGAASRNGLIISSKLLQLAKIVGENYRNDKN